MYPKRSFWVHNNQTGMELPRTFFHSFLGEGICDVYEITKIRTIKGSEAKEFTPDETHSDDIRLAFHLRFHHKVSEQIIKIDTSRMIDYSFIDTNFENLKSLIVTED